MTDMSIKYWGVRGSIPAPIDDDDVRTKMKELLHRLAGDSKAMQSLVADSGESLERSIDTFLDSQPRSIVGTYGGNTSCVEVQVRDSPLIVFDSGTGIRKLGQSLVGRLFSPEANFNPLNSVDRFKNDIHLFLSHYHWDHIQGLPFFIPGFLRQADVSFYGKENARQPLSDVLRGQQEYPNFPVVWDDMPCNKAYKELKRFNGEPIQLGNATISSTELNHPDAVFGYSVQINGKKFVYATDCEHRNVPDPRLVELAQDADILYYDSQYTPEEYVGKDAKSSKFDWGHSTYEYAVLAGIQSGAKIVVCGHHDPDRTDVQLEDIQRDANEFKDNQQGGNSLRIIVAYEGLQQQL